MKNFYKYIERMKRMNKLSLALVIIGALNWGSIGIFKFDLVAWLFGTQISAGSRIIYTLVGIAGLWCITLLFGRKEETV